MASRSLAERLDQAGRDIGPDWGRLYDAFVARMRASGAGSGALAQGDRMPPFALPNSRGEYVLAESLVAKGPLVLNFYRGGWCPYCRATLTAWREAASDLNRLGASLVIITPETGGRAETVREELGLNCEILCDVDHGVALAMGLVVRLADTVRDAYLHYGLDFESIYGNASWFLPIPATYVIDPAGIIRYADVDVDFRRRAEPADVIQATAKISR